MTIRAVLLDLSGVLYVGDKVLPGAGEALSRLRGSALELRYLTNTTRTPEDGLVAQLRQMGLDVPREALFTVTRAARRHLEARGLHPFLLVHEAVLPDFAGLDTDTPDAVLLGDAGESLTYGALNAAFRLLHGGAPLIAMGRNRYFQDVDGLSLDQGPFVAALEYAAGVQAEVVGKPAPAFFQAALDDLGCPPSEAVMIGDDLHADIGGAQAAGVPGLLVRTGKYRPEDERDPHVHPFRVLDDFAAAVDWLLERR